MVYYIIPLGNCKKYFFRESRYSSSQLLGVFSSEFGEAASVQGVPDALHKIVVEIQVVHYAQPHGKHFLGDKQMPQIGPGIAAANRAVTLGVNGLLV